MAWVDTKGVSLPAHNAQRIMRGMEPTETPVKGGPKVIPDDIDLSFQWCAWWDNDDWTVTLLPAEGHLAKVLLSHDEATPLFLGVFTAATSVPEISARILEVQRFLRYRDARESIHRDLIRAHRIAGHNHATRRYPFTGYPFTL